jgi:hypothetical protein
MIQRAKGQSEFPIWKSTLSKHIEMVPSKACQQWIRNWLLHAGLYEPSTCEPEDLIADYADALEDFYLDNSTELPHALWRTRSSLDPTATLTRIEAFVGWGLPV